MTKNPDPVTLMIANTIKPGKLKEYRVWVKGISDAARNFDGYGGTQFIKPPTNNNRTVHAMIHFRDHVSLSNWEESEIRYQWLEKLPDLVESRKTEKMDGIEFWFEPPNTPLQKPKKYRMAVLTLLAIYPQILLIPQLISTVLPDYVPRYLAILVSCICTVTLMTWVIMPTITQFFSRWIYKNE
ncbi:hypothetical protein ACH42_10575 [Endozoicomonas sp. (ex Bugula neritina AB1)]|nr:hypothetical protein ACH42_10575 [Endozoicomonas sp. (ex Bugula neritina AB1)]